MQHLQLYESFLTDIEAQEQKTKNLASQMRTADEALKTKGEENYKLLAQAFQKLATLDKSFARGLRLKIPYTKGENVYVALTKGTRDSGSIGIFGLELLDRASKKMVHLDIYPSERLTVATVLDAIQHNYPEYFEGQEMGFFLTEAHLDDFKAYQGKIDQYQQQISALKKLKAAEKIKAKALKKIVQHKIVKFFESFLRDQKTFDLKGAFTFVTLDGKACPINIIRLAYTRDHIADLQLIGKLGETEYHWYLQVENTNIEVDELIQIEDWIDKNYPGYLEGAEMGFFLKEGLRIKAHSEYIHKIVRAVDKWGHQLQIGMVLSLKQQLAGPIIRFLSYEHQDVEFNWVVQVAENFNGRTGEDDYRLYLRKDSYGPGAITLHLSELTPSELKLIWDVIYHRYNVELEGEEQGFLLKEI